MPRFTRWSVPPTRYARDMATHAVLASRVELAAKVVRGDVHVRLLDAACDLDVRRRLDELHAGEGALRDEPRAVRRLCVVPISCERRRWTDRRGNVGLGRKRTFVHQATSYDSESPIATYKRTRLW